MQQTRAARHPRNFRRALPGAVLVLGLLGGAACGGHRVYVRPGFDAACSECAAPSAQLDTRILLIGDTGELLPDNPALQALAALSADAPARTMAVFLGDNIYPRGLPAAEEIGVDAERREAGAILQLQVDAVRAAGIRAVFVPGNHDWDKSGPRGMARVAAQEDFFRAADADVALLPGGGCPGPVVVDLGSTVRILAVDSEWLLRADLPREEECRWGAPEAPVPLPLPGAAGFYAALESAVRGAGHRRVLLATHHPLKTRGSHGGYFSGKDLLFPLTHLKGWLYLPVPFLYPLLRYSVVRSDQDLHGSRNREMVRQLERALAGAAIAPIAVAGHEHALQVFDDPQSQLWYLVSGSGAKVEPTGKDGDTIFKHARTGLMALDFFVDGRVSLRVLTTDGQQLRQAFAMWLSAEPRS
jgi:hypothetical protein